MNGWEVLGAIGKGIAKTVEVIGTGVSTATETVVTAPDNVRDSMAVTEITSVFNTTDKTIKFVNRESLRDSKEVLGQSAASLRSDKTAGAWVPWYDPPRFADFSLRRMEILVDEVPMIYIWQRGEFIYWTNRLDSQGRPAKSYKIPGVAHVGGKRMLVVRNDPENGYSAFLSESVDEKK